MREASEEVPADFPVPGFLDFENAGKPESQYPLIQEYTFNHTEIRNMFSGIFLNK